MKRFKIFFIVLCSVLAAKAQSIVFNNQVPKHEVRAVWLTTIGGIDWPHSYAQSSFSAEKQKRELTNILDRLQQAKINTILIQTRVRGTMIYPSAYEPWDGCLSGFPGRSPGYDALKFAIDECHKRGMELHAWVVTIPVGKWNALGCKTLRQKMPKLIKKIGADGYMDPENSRTGDYLANICREITHKYNVDGIHLDYIRYPETWNIKVSREQGRRYITNIVRKIHDAVKAEKPWVKMSCSPVGKYDDLSRYRSFGWNAYTKVCQDAQGWLKSGLMDELFPMMYFRDEHFYPFAIDWQEQSHGKIVVPGLGIYFLDPKEGKWNINDVTAEMYHIRNLGMGYAFFRNKFLLDNKQGILDFTQRFNPYPSLVPPMTWASKNQPEQPQQLSVITSDNNVSVSWSNPSNYTDGTKIATPYKGMKGKNNQEETYFLGKAQETRYTKSHLHKKVFGIAACVIAIIGIALILMFKPQSVSQPHVLKTIAVLPEGGQMPVFNGNGDINDFLRWVMTNIQYPKGLEDKPARVVINFTVQKDGTLGLFKVLEAPKEKAYEQTVIELLKRSPHWKPARLSDGEEVNMEFTLPVVFTPEVRKK